MRPKIFCLFCAGFFLVLFITSVFCIPYLINTSFVKDKILFWIEQKTGVILPSEKFSLSLFMEGRTPFLVTKFKEVDFPFSTEINVAVGNIQTEWDIRELVRGQPACPVIQIKNVEIGLPPVITSNPSDLSFPDWNFLLSCLPEHPKKIQLVFTNISCPFFSSLSGTCSLDRDKGFFQCKAQIQNLQVKKTQIGTKDSWLRYFFFDTVKTSRCDISLTTNLSGRNIESTIVFHNFSLDSSRLKKPLRPASDIKIVFSRQPEKFHLHIDPVQWNFPRSVLEYSWTFHKGKTPAWHMILSGQKIYLDQAASVGLALGSESMIVQNLFDILRGGKAEQVQVSFASSTMEKMFEPSAMTISGSLENGTVKIPNSSCLLTNVRASAGLTEGKLRITAYNGTLGNSQIGPATVEIDLVNTPGFPFQAEFDVDADLAQVPEIFSTLLPDSALAREMKQIQGVSGCIQGQVFLEYHPDRPVVFQADAKKVWGTIDYAPLGQTLKIHEGAFICDNDHILLTNICAEMGKSSLSNFSGKIDFSVPHNMNISSEKIFLDAAQGIIPLQNLSWVSPDTFQNIQGSISANHLSLSGPLSKPSQWKYEISGHAENLYWQFPSQLDHFFTKFGMNPLSGNFVATQEFLDWENTLSFPLQARIKKVTNGFQIQLNHMDLCDFITTGSVFLSQEDSTNMIDAAFHIHSRENSTTSSVFACLLRNESMVEAPCTLVCDVTCKGLVKDFQKNLQGNLSFSSFDGRIYKATFLARVLSAINILHVFDITQKGFEYHSMKMDAKITDGKIVLTHARIDAKDMLLIFTGQIDPFAEKLDMLCLVAPLKTFDNILQYIPMIHFLIGKSLVTIPVRIQGSFKNPDIVPMHPSDVGKGLMNMLERVLSAPVRLLNISEKDPQGKEGF